MIVKIDIVDKNCSLSLQWRHLSILAFKIITKYTVCSTFKKIKENICKPPKGPAISKMFLCRDVIMLKFGRQMQPRWILVFLGHTKDSEAILHTRGPFN